MKIDSLLFQLEEVRRQAEDLDDDNYRLVPTAIINVLLDYISNDKVKEKVDEIPF